MINRLVLKNLCINLAMVTVLSACQTEQRINQADDRTQMAAARTALSVAYLQTGDLDSAKRQLDTALSHQANYAPALRMLGITYSTEGSASSLAQADGYFRQALQADNADMATHLAYANHLMKVGDAPRAVAYYDNAAKTLGFSGRLTALENLAYIHYQAWLKMPSDAAKQEAQSALSRALSAGSQQAELRQAARQLNVMP